MIETKYGVIRQSQDEILKGYVNFGKNYFSVNELEIFNHYFDLGFVIIDSYYVLQGAVHRIIISIGMNLVKMCKSMCE